VGEASGYGKVCVALSNDPDDRPLNGVTNSNHSVIARCARQINGQVSKKGRSERRHVPPRLLLVVAYRFCRLPDVMCRAHAWNQRAPLSRRACWTEASRASESRAPTPAGESLAATERRGPRLSGRSPA